jgi:8-oxo-dGTP pyrophosphatase MutT (NUDIX family)
MTTTEKTKSADPNSTYLKAAQVYDDGSIKAKYYAEAIREDEVIRPPWVIPAGSILLFDEQKFERRRWSLQKHPSKAISISLCAIRELKEETGYSAKDVISIGHYTLDYSMFEQKGNLFVAYDLVKVGSQSLGIMEKIDLKGGI